MQIYHALPISNWIHFREAGAYRPDSLAAQGYVHLSTRPQALRVLSVLFAGRSDVVLLEVESETLGDCLKWEAADVTFGAHESENELFPHLYRAIQLDEVRRVWMREAFEEQIDL